MSALDKALEKWKKNPQKQAEAVQGRDAKRVKKEPKPRAGAVKKPTVGPNVKSEPITDMKAHLRTHVLPKDVGVPLPKQVKDSLDALQKAQIPLSAKELEEKTGHPCEPGTALADQLTQNPKIVMVEEKYKFKGAADVMVKDQAAALQYIKKARGCLLRDFTDSRMYANAEKDVEKMHKDGIVWIMPAGNKNDKVVFCRDQPALISVSDSITKAWHAVKMPEDLEDEAKEMKKANLASAVQYGKRERPKFQKKEREKKKRATNFSRFTRITNNHLPQLFQGEVGSID